METDRVSPAASLEMPAAAVESAPSWMLIEVLAYFDNVKNATTAVSTTSDNKHIQITFCPRPPPLLSRFCIHSPDGAAMFYEPSIIATQEDIALIRVDTNGCGMFADYYLYQADDGSGKPSLTLLPRAPNGLYFHPKDIGLLRLPGKEYIVAGFRFLPFAEPKGGFPLCVYDSNLQYWKIYALSLSPQGELEYGDQFFFHKNCKVVTVGGEAGTMALVDLWRGVVFCDVLKVQQEAAPAPRVHGERTPLLGYVSLPDDLGGASKIKGDARLYRDMAFLDGHLKCLDLATLSLWIRPATTSGAWSRQNMISGFKAIERCNRQTNLLPGHKGVYRSFKNLLLCQPVVGLQDLQVDEAPILYFTIKTHTYDDHASVLAVDMKTKKIVGVAPFFQRYEIINFTYVHTRLSKHLPGAQATLKQSGVVLQGSSSKMKDAAQEQLDGESVAEVVVPMALD